MTKQRLQLRQRFPWAGLIHKLEKISRDLVEINKNVTAALKELAKIEQNTAQVKVFSCKGDCDAALKQVREKVQGLVAHAVPVIYRIAEPIRYAADRVNDTLEVFFTINEKFDATAASFNTCAKRFHPLNGYWDIKAKVDMLYIVHLIVVAITTLLIFGLSIYVEFYYAILDFDAYLNDPFFSKSTCAFHPRVGELDGTWKELITRPPHRWLLRMKHAWFYQRCSGLLHLACRMLMFLSIVLTALVIVISVAMMFYGVAISGLCDLEAAEIVADGDVCNSFFNDLQGMLGRRVLSGATCEESHVLVCPDAIRPLYACLNNIVLFQILGVVLLFWQRHRLIEQIQMTVREALDDICDEQVGTSKDLKDR